MSRVALPLPILACAIASALAASDAGTPGGLGPGGLRVIVRDLATATTTIVSPGALLGAFSAAAGAWALHPGDARLCSLAPQAW